jgi:hypothetical protein
MLTVISPLASNHFEIFKIKIREKTLDFLNLFFSNENWVDNFSNE